MTYDVTVGERAFSIRVDRDKAGGWTVQIDDGPARHIDARSPEPSVLSLVMGDRSYEAGLAPRDDGWEVDLLGRAYHCAVVDPRRAALKLGGGAGAGAIKTSMPGLVVRVMVEEGALVEEGDPLLVLEAMKMENEITAPIDGRIAAVHVAAGESLEAGAKLIQIDPLDETEA